MVISNQVFEGTNNMVILTQPKVRDKFRFEDGHVGTISGFGTMPGLSDKPNIPFVEVESRTYGYSRFSVSTLEVYGVYQGVIVWQVKED